MNKMKYQEIINFLGNTPTQLSKFRTKHWFEINDDRNGTYHKKILSFKLQCEM